MDDGDAADLPVIPARGRARSHSMHEATHADLAGEIDALNGGAGAAAPAPAATGASAQPKAGQLSKKTITMLTDLTAAASGVPPELEAAQEHILSEMELAERELAAEEQRRAHDGVAGAPAPPAAGAGGSSVPAPRAGGGQRKQKGDEKDYDVVIKLLLLGDGGVGKTSLSETFAEPTAPSTRHDIPLGSRRCSAQV